ncbi:Putative amidase AmiD [bacterium HR29]|nr:Putative amidase AmiD [bacterium HR29]
MAERLTDLTRLTIAEAGRRLRAGEVTSAELTEACLSQIDAVEPVLNAFITVLADQALADARRADEELRAGRDRGPLHGIPVAVKDLCQTKGVRTTAGSDILRDWLPEEDATVVRRLRDGGAVLLGKLNLHEFAYGVTSANRWYGPVANPWDTQRHPGGSSGGSGAAVAAFECFMAVGTDTGGSVRIPAALCGVVGLMPTYGLVSRAGVVPLAWSLDHVGPLARTVEDAALALNVMAGYDPADPTSADVPEFDAAAELGRPIDGVRIGVAWEQFERVTPDVRRACEEAVRTVAGLGARVTEVTLPYFAEMATTRVLVAEAAAYHVRWLREMPERYSDDLRALFLRGLAVTAVEYLADLRLRRHFTERIRELMREVDVIMLPTCPMVACRFEEIDATVYRYASLTSPWDHTGQPVISVPCGFGDSGMPVGISFAGRPFEEALLCRVAHAYEQARGPLPEPPAARGGDSSP